MNKLDEIRRLKKNSPILQNVPDDILENRLVELEFNPNQPRDPKGSETGGQWTDTGIIEKYETYNKEHVLPWFNKMREKRLDNLSPDATKHWSYANKSVGEEVPLTDEELEIMRNYYTNVKTLNAMYPEYKKAIEAPAYKRAKFIEKIKAQGKIINSQYAGKSPLTGKSFPAGTKIYYAKITGISYGIPISEIE